MKISRISCVYLLLAIFLSFLPSFGFALPARSGMSGPCRMYDDGTVLCSPFPKATPTPRPVECSSGSLPGDFEVDGFGQANYTMPIEVPPGTHEMQPKLTLRYGSFNPNGHLGIGWKIEGASVIMRCAASQAEDGALGGVYNTSSDRFCLDGTKLVAVSGNYGDDGTIYSTNPDRVMQIVSHNYAGSPSDGYGPKFFVVKTKDGLTMEYGGNDTYEQGRIEESISPVVRVWALSRVTDRFGNYIDFRYGENQARGEYWLDEVWYTGHCASAVVAPTPSASPTPAPIVQGLNESSNLGFVDTSFTETVAGDVYLPEAVGESYSPVVPPGGCAPVVSPYNHVKFVYDDFARSDSLKLFASGASTDLTKRLNRIETYAGNDTNPVSTYKLTYETSQATYVSRLTSIERCGVGNVCLPKTTVTWSDPLNGSLKASSSINLTNGLHGFKTFTGWWAASQPYANAMSPVMAAIQIASGGMYPTISPQFSRGTDGRVSTTFNVSYFGINYPFGYGTYTISRSLFGDYNGDGRTDVVDILDGGTAKVRIASNNGTQAVFSSESQWGSGLGVREEVKTGDFNGDGKVDLVQVAGDGNSYVNLSTGESFSPPGSFVAYGTGAYKNIFVVDLNGDGKSDLLWIKAPGEDGGEPLSAWISTGTSFSAKTFWGQLSATHSDRITLADMDGDGRTDLVHYYDDPPQGTDPTIYVYRGTDAGFVDDGDPGINVLSLDLTEHAVIQSGDFNGDGKADLVIFDRDRTFWDPTYYLNYARFYLSIGDKEFGRPKLSRAAYLDYTLTNDGAITRDGGIAPTWNFRSRIADFNGDGRADILNLTKNGNPTMRYSRGTSWNVVTDYVSHDFGTTLDDVQVTDIDGDGRPDIKEINGTFANAWLNNARPVNDRVASITDGYKKRIEIIHKPLTAVSSCFNQPVPSGSDPLERAFTSAMNVVSEYGISDGVGGMYRYEKNYQCPRYSYNYGFLGYEMISTHDVPRDIYDNTYYNQSFPLTGMVKEERRWVNSDILLASINDKTSTYFWQATNYPVNGTSINRINMLQEHHTVSELDLVGAEDTSIEYDYDIYQNQLQKLTLKNLTYEREDNTFYNDPATWTLGLATQTTYLNIKSDVADQTRSVQRTFDNATRAQLTESTSWLAGTTPNVHNFQFDYDTLGNKISEIESGTNVASRTTSYNYDPIGQFQVLSTNPLGHAVATTYEPKFGNLQNEVDANNLPTSFSFDAFGRTISETRPDGTTSAVTYCPVLNAGEPLPPPLAVASVQLTTTGQPTIKKFYDVLKRPILELTQGFDGSNIATNTVYSPLLNISSTTAPYYYATGVSYATNYFYDVLNRIKRVNYPSGAYATVSYQGGPVFEPNTIILTTPLHGRTVTTETSTDAHRKVIVLDDRGRPLQIQEYSIITEALLGLSTYLYDAGGNLHKTSDADNNITTITWDNNNNRIALNDPDSGILSLSNNARGETISQVDALNRTTTYSYDLLGRVTQRYAEAGEVDLANWVWDTASNGVGKLASSEGINSFFVGESVQSQFHYDALSRLSSLTQTANFPGNQSFPLSASIGYDSAGRLSDLTYPGSVPFAVHYGYTTSGYVNSVTRPATGETFWTASAQTARNQVSSFTFGNGLQVNQTYDPIFGSLKEILYPQNPFLNNRYFYDAVGRLTRREALLGSYENIEYDPLSRVVSSSSGTGSQSFPTINIAYDQIGNITSKSDVGFYEYDNFSSGPHALSNIYAPPTNASFAYNAVGNMISGKGRTYTWTIGNQLEKITSSAGNTEFRYTPERTKYWRKEYGTLTTTTMFFGRIYERDGESAVPNDERRFVYVNGEPILVHSGAESAFTLKQYMHSDVLGSLAALSLQSGAVADVFSYDPFGMRRQPDFAPTGPAIVPFSTRGFTNHDMLDKHALIDMQARPYDPQIGRFMSPDPVISSITKTQAHNRYSYVSNNPTNMVDPTGLIGEGAANAGAAAVGGGVARFGGELTAQAVNTSSNLAGQALTQLVSTAVSQATQTNPKFDPKLAKIDLKAQGTTSESTGVAKRDPDPLARQEALRKKNAEKERLKWKQASDKFAGTLKDQIDADLERAVSDGVSGAQDALDMRHVKERAKEWGMTEDQAKAYIAGRALWNLFNAAGAGSKGGLFVKKGSNGNNF